MPGDGALRGSRIRGAQTNSVGIPKLSSYGAPEASDTATSSGRRWRQRAREVRSRTSISDQSHPASELKLSAQSVLFTPPYAALHDDASINKYGRCISVYLLDKERALKTFHIDNRALVPSIRRVEMQCSQQRALGGDSDRSPVGGRRRAFVHFVAHRVRRVLHSGPRNSHRIHHFEGAAARRLRTRIDVWGRGPDITGRISIQSRLHPASPLCKTHRIWNRPGRSVVCSRSGALDRVHVRILGGRHTCRNERACTGRTNAARVGKLPRRGHLAHVYSYCACLAVAAEPSSARNLRKQRHSARRLDGRRGTYRPFSVIGVCGWSDLGRGSCHRYANTPFSA